MGQRSRSLPKRNTSARWRLFSGNLEYKNLERREGSITKMFALLFDLEDYATTYRATRDAYLKAANELKLATGAL